MDSPPRPPPKLFAWLVLAALGLRARHEDVVTESGGPEAVLALPAAELRARFDVRRWQTHPPDEKAREVAEAHARSALGWRGEAKGERRILVGEQLARARRAPSAPLVAFARGPKGMLARTPALAIVGSRAATARGEERAAALATEAAEQGIVVVSGGAMGIDMAAHEAALAAGGSTVVVLGDPVRARADERPARVRALERYAPRLVTLTPHGPWDPSSPGLWVSRNRVIAALADAVVVIEGRSRSGTRYTADAARALGLPVLAVPGDPDDEIAATPNALLREGVARPLLDHEDALGVVLGRPRRRARPPPRAGPPVERSPAEAALLLALEGAGPRLAVDEAARRSGLTIGELLGVAFELELKGLVRREGSALVRGRRA